MNKYSEAENANSIKNEKPSRWWMIYHFWAGICVQIYVDISGLSKFIVGAPTGSDPASASSYAIFSTVVVVGAFALGYYLSICLIKKIDQSEMPRKGKITLKSILPIGYFLMGVLLAAVTAPLVSKPDISQRSTSAGQESNIKPVIAFTTTQSSEGIKETDLDQSGLKNLETLIVDIILQKGRNKFSEMGYNANDYNPTVSAGSVYINIGDKKLAVIKVKMDDSMRSVTILGIQGAELLRVSCIRASNRDILLWSGECGNEINKTFGVSIGR